MTETETTPIHFITWTHDRDCVRPKVSCTGPENATCRLTCADPNCSAEEFDGFYRDADGNPFHANGEDDDGNEIVHPMKDGGFCNVAEFLNEGGCIDEEAVDTPAFVIGTVPIEPVWQGDYYAWKRAETSEGADVDHLTDLLEKAARAGRRANNDPGSFVKRIFDDGDGDVERLDRWQERALRAAVAELAAETSEEAVPDHLDLSGLHEVAPWLAVKNEEGDRG